jgi:hypothetical protein
MRIQAFVNLLLLRLIAPSNGAITSYDVSKGNLEAAYDALQRWYNHTNGLWIPSTGWWNSANCMLNLNHDPNRILKQMQASLYLLE